MSKHEFFDSKPNRTKQYLTRPELLAMSREAARRFLLDKGIIGPKLKSQWEVDIGEREKIRVVAYTKSEARAELKKEMGLKRLPPCLNIKRVV